MRLRYLLLICVVVFAATLAVIVGETLSSEAMSMMVGVVAGVGASIPASLLILWFAVRTAELRAVAASPAQVIYPREAPEPHIVVVTVPTAQPQAYAGYAPPGYEQPAAVRPALPAPAQRRFTVVGGGEAALVDGFVLGEPQYQEVAWQR